PGRGTGGLGLRAPGARVRRRRDGRCGRRRGHPASGGGRGRADPGTGRDERARRRPGGGRAGRRAMTATLEKPPTASGPEPGGGRAARSLSTPWQVLIVLVVWVLGWAIFRGTDTLELGGAELTGFQTWLNELRDAFDSARQGSFFFEYIIDPISAVLDAVINWLRELLSQPAFPRPVPEIGWLGVVALFTYLAYWLAGVRSAILVFVGLLLFGFLGYWPDSIDTLIVTFVAVF